MKYCITNITIAITIAMILSVLPVFALPAALDSIPVLALLILMQANIMPKTGRMNDKINAVIPKPKALFAAKELSVGA